MSDHNRTVFGYAPPSASTTSTPAPSDGDSNDATIQDDRPWGEQMGQQAAPHTPQPATPPPAQPTPPPQQGFQQGQQGYPPQQQQGYPPQQQQGYPPQQQQGYPPQQQQGYPPQQQQGYPPQQQGYPPQQQQGYAQPGYGAAPQMPHVQPVKAGFYLAMIWIPGIVGTGLMAWGLTDSKVTELLGFAWMPMIVSAVFFCRLLYKAWFAIGDGYARTTPGLAVGYLFIPVFVIYWMFVAIGSWGKEYNAFADRHHLGGFRASGVFLFHCICMLVPGASLATPITGTMIIIQMCHGINSVASRGLPPARLHG